MEKKSKIKRGKDELSDMIEEREYADTRKQENRKREENSTLDWT